MYVPFSVIFDVGMATATGTGPWNDSNTLSQTDLLGSYLMNQLLNEVASPAEPNFIGNL